MQRCYNSAVRMPKEPWLCCYGAPGCTAAPLSSKPSTSQPQQAANTTSNGKDPKQASGSGPRCQHLRLELSEDASMQDLYLLIKISYAAGWRASEHVQATPSKESAPSPLGTAEQFGSWIKECQATEWRLCSGVLLPCSKSTTPSSKRSASYSLSDACEEPKPGCLGKLQEGRQ